MYQPPPAIPTGRPLIRRFWTSASGFWLGDTRRTAWLLTFGLIVLILIQLAFQYRMNIWNRDIFNALEKKDGDAVLTQALIFGSLVVTMVGLAIVAVYGRMTMQRQWRAWLTEYLIARVVGEWPLLPTRSGDGRPSESRRAASARCADRHRRAGRLRRRHLQRRCHGDDVRRGALVCRRQSDARLARRNPSSSTATW